MAKKLNINASVCDVRKVQEETLANFDTVEINAALLITGARAQALLARYSVNLNAASTIILDDETTLNTINGKATFSGRNTPNGRQFLIVNGTITVTPDAGDALRQYMGLVVNGAAYCPESLTTVLASKGTINGKLFTYPDGAVVLKNNAVIDRSFALRAEGRLYWAAKRLIAVDGDIDCEALAAKGIRFSSEEAYIAESLAEDLAPLFDPDTRLIILPDGVSVVQDDLTLNAAGLRRYSAGLLVLGDLRLSGDCGDALGELEYLQVEGDVYLSESLAGALNDVPETVFDGDVHYLPGTPLFDKAKLTVDKALLDAFPDGLTLVNCAKVTLDDELTPADVLEHLSFYDCSKAICKPALQSAVSAVSTLNINIAINDQPEEDTEEENAPDTMIANASTYTM